MTQSGEQQEVADSANVDWRKHGRRKWHKSGIENVRAVMG